MLYPIALMLYPSKDYIPNTGPDNVHVRLSRAGFITLWTEYAIKGFFILTLVMK